jgi:Rho guanine nucleotide exchange factor 10
MFLQDYEKPLIDSKPRLISTSAIRAIFHKVRDILQCHNMFDIELSEAARLWDEEEKIGNVFTASVGKVYCALTYFSFVLNCASCVVVTAFYILSK